MRRKQNGSGNKTCSPMSSHCKHAIFIGARSKALKINKNWQWKDKFGSGLLVRSTNGFVAMYLGTAWGKNVSWTQGVDWERMEGLTIGNFRRNDPGNIINWKNNEHLQHRWGGGILGQVNDPKAKHGGSSLPPHNSGEWSSIIATTTPLSRKFPRLTFLSLCPP